MYTTCYFTSCVGTVPCFDTSVNGTAVTAAAAQLQSVIAAESAMEEQHPSRQGGAYRVTALP